MKKETSNEKNAPIVHFTGFTLKRKAELLYLSKKAKFEFLEKMDKKTKKKADFLVAGEKAGKEKANLAKTLNIETIAEEKFLKMVEDVCGDTDSILKKICEDNILPICPYSDCRTILCEKPSSKKKCTYCKKDIFAVKGQLFTSEEIDEMLKLYSNKFSNINKPKAKLPPDEYPQDINRKKAKES